jgi:hypothetical protein
LIYEAGFFYACRREKRVFFLCQFRSKVVNFLLTRYQNNRKIITFPPKLPKIAL